MKKMVKEKGKEYHNKFKIEKINQNTIKEDNNEWFF